MENEKYDTVYNLAKPVKYFLRIKTADIFKDLKISKNNQLIVVNHHSFIDSFLLFIFLYEQLGTNFVFVAKKELEDKKIGRVLKLIDSIFIDRNNLRQMVSSINDQVKIMKERNKSIVLFPEGTRNTTKNLLEFKSGAFELAYKNICPIQPIIFLNTEDYWEDRKQTKIKRDIVMEVLEPIQPNNFLHIDRQIFAKNVQKKMQDAINKHLKNN